MELPPVDRIADLQLLIAQFGNVKRVLNLPNVDRRENDNDHSFGLALTCWYLQPKIAPELDLGEIFKYALAHDLVELHAGDTFVFDEVAMASKPERERDAVVKLRNEWTDFPELSQYSERYIDRYSEETRFVKAVDKLLPPIMIELSEHKEWDRLKITLEDERENKKSIHVSSYLSPYYDLLIQWLDQRGHIAK